MSRVTRDSFVNSSKSLDVGHLEADERAALAEAGLDAATLTRVAGNDGVISGKAELGELFAAIDGLDRDGNRTSIATTKRNAAGAEVATASGAALAALEREIADARARQGRRPEPPPSSAQSTTSNATASGLLAGNAAFDSDPKWLASALKEYDTTETKGTAANPRIIEYFDRTYRKGQHSDDSGKANAWCAAFITFCLAENDIKNRKAVGAREYETWGEASEPFRGAIVVLKHGNQKHVAILVGVDKDGTNLYLSGNQDNRVQTAALAGYEVLAIRKPHGFDIPAALKTLPTLDARTTAATR
ncbi:MAG TPA: TIGR02594 family protein [Polyangia bacterium]